MPKTWQSDDVFADLTKLAATDPALAQRCQAALQEVVTCCALMAGCAAANPWLQTMHVNTTGPGGTVSMFAVLRERD